MISDLSSPRSTAAVLQKMLAREATRIHLATADVDCRSRNSPGQDVLKEALAVQNHFRQYNVVAKRFCPC